MWLIIAAFRYSIKQRNAMVSIGFRIFGYCFLFFYWLLAFSTYWVTDLQIDRTTKEADQLKGQSKKGDNPS